MKGGWDLEFEPSVEEIVDNRIAGNFRGRKLSWIGRKGAFTGENFRGTLKLVA